MNLCPLSSSGGSVLVPLPGKKVEPLVNGDWKFGPNIDWIDLGCSTGWPGPGPLVWKFAELKLKNEEDCELVSCTMLLLTTLPRLGRGDPVKS